MREGGKLQDRLLSVENGQDEVLARLAPLEQEKVN